ncbi:MAG: penicillin-binding protein 1C [Synergistaceae bacterium]|nr:penicillin-binding protein 1C [Synergistaceae bacterium]
MALAFFCLFYLETQSVDSNSIKKFDVSHSVLDSNGKIMSAYLSARDEWCIPVSLDKMGRWTEAVAIAAEDKRFYNHHGVDLLAVTRATFDNIKAGRIVSGASTITTQLIRISHPRPRTFVVKLIEFWAALRLETKFSKRDILEMYLNRAPFGGNIRGVEAASMAYFNKSANALSLSESALLISLVKSPSTRRPDRYAQKAKTSRDALLSYLLSRNVISQENMKFAIAEPVAQYRFNMPRRNAMASKHALENSSGSDVIRSTINAKYQQILRENLERALSPLPNKITAAGVIVHNESAQILAYIGNARHGQALPTAQVDCGDAPRSPGSTLKPFVYARAFETGLLTPASLLSDTPISFSGNAPRNYDMTHRGAVSARTALSLSLNTPSVRVLRKLGYSKIRSLFNELGFSYIDKESSHYTDSLVLGGCEVTLLQLAASYRALAGSGKFTPLKWTKDGSLKAREVFSVEAAWLTANILQDEKRLTPLYQQIFKETNRIIAFKTGTSHGLRDAWSAGFSNSFTVVVWFGAPDGTPDGRLVGLELAAPAMLHILKEISSERDGIEAPRPAGIYARKVCSLSGAPAGKYCPQTIMDFAIKDVSDVSLCDIHKFSGGRIVTQLPKELDVWMQTRGRSDIPSSGIKITRPFQNRKIIMHDNDKGTAKVLFAAEGRLPHYWYLDGKFLSADTTGGGLLADVPAGRHKVSVLSGSESDDRQFEIISADVTATKDGLKVLVPEK